jgi:hypothetical protein
MAFVYDVRKNNTGLCCARLSRKKEIIHPLKRTLFAE